MKDVINSFYSAFANGDWQTMSNCYHENAEFNDPVFKGLKGQEVGAMWQMLIERSKGNLQISFKNTEADEKKGKADWVAEYLFSATGRKVINQINAEFEFKEGKISKHTDHFNLYKWASQAMGLKGQLLGWLPFFRKKVQKTAKKSLDHFINKKI